MPYALRDSRIQASYHGKIPQYFYQRIHFVLYLDIIAKQNRPIKAKTANIPLSTTMFTKIFTKKSVAQILSEQENAGHKLKRTLGLWSLIAIGIGCIIGTGIFVLTGKVALMNAGPGVIISFAICGVACIFAALCYAEFASFIPISGSAYTYSYASMGELVAWIIGWDLMLEYGLSTAAVASGWSSYFVNLFTLLGFSFPEAWALTPFEKIPGTEMHGFINLPAMCIVLLVTTLLTVGIKESSRVNNIMVVVKVGVALTFILIGAMFVLPENWLPLVPEFVPTAGQTPAHIDIETTEMWKVIANWMGYDPVNGFGGWQGIVMGASIIFFAYIGFDAVSTTSEEARNPSRDVPRSIIISLLVCTLLYILMAAVFTGIVRSDGSLTLDDLGVDKGAPLVYAFKQVDNVWVNRYAALFVDIGGLAGISSVLLVTLFGQSRVFFSMSRDGLIPQWISKVHPRFGTPYRGTLLTGLLISVVAGFVPLGTIAEMANIGTLFAFVLVAGGILYLRKHQPDIRPSFRTPWVPFVPLMAMGCCLALMFSLPAVTWIRFIVWMALGIVVYFLYGYRHSKLHGEKAAVQTVQ